MTTPASPGGSPLRIGGFALIGVGIVAGVIGLATAAVGDDGGSTTSAAPTSVSVSAPAPPPPATTPADGSVPVPSFGPTATDGIAAPPAPSAAPVPGATGADGAGVAGVEGARGAESMKAPVRIYNNSTIQGLAARAESDFRNAGWTVTEIKGYPYGVIGTSTVYYRPGTSEQAAAETLASQFGLRSEPRFDGIQDASPGLIVIVTKDYQSR